MQEDAFSRQLGSRDSGKGLSGKGTEKGTVPNAKAQKQQKESDSAEIAKAKEQSAYKDAQLSALAGQLKKAGVTPDFSSV